MSNIVTLDQVRRHLRYPAADTMDDIEMNIMIQAADEVMKFECGDFIPAQFEEFYDGGDTSIWLRHTPVLSVELIEEGWGYINWELDYVQVNSPPGSLSMFAYSIDNPEMGEITRRTAGNIVIPFMIGDSNIRAAYTSGRTPIPGAIVLAELELIAHWFQNSQQRATASATAYSYDAVNTEFPHSGSDIFTSINVGVPFRILEMIKAYRKPPIMGLG